MCPARKQEFDISKDKIRTARTSFVSNMAGGGGFEKIAEAAMEKLGESVTSAASQAATSAVKNATEAQPATPPPSQKRNESEDVNKWARGELQVEEVKKGMRDHLPKAAEVVLIIIMVGLLSIAPMLSTENKIMRNIILIAVCFMFVAKDYLYQWLRQRIHVPEFIMDPWLLLNLGVSIIIVWAGIPIIAAIILILVVTILASFGPYFKQKWTEWRKKKKIEKGEEVEAKKEDLDSRLAKVMKGALLSDVLDFVVGWIPIAGDFIGFALNLRLPISAKMHRLIGMGAFLKMVLVNVVDMCVGFIPVVGDFADVFPSNIINQKILKSEVERKKNNISEGGSTFVTVLLLIFIIIGGLGGFVVFIAPLSMNYGGPFGEAMTSIASIPTNSKAWWTEHNPWTAIQNYYKKQVAYATGDYYTGKVDENAQAKLGVYLEDIKQADPIFYTDRPVGMFATLTVQTLDEPVNVTIVCSDDKAKAGSPPQIYPKNHFVVETYEEQDIDCMYEAGTIEKGASIFKIGADFNFKTLGYVKGYFMDNERLRTMRREEIDPLDQYGIKDKKPSAIYTNGPVGIGMGLGSLPVGIDLDSEYEAMTLGITLENKWQGKIMGVSRMIVILPKGFTLEEIGATKTQISCDALKPEERELCDPDFNIVYSVSDPTFVTIDKGNFKSYRGFLRVNSADYEKILGKITPISTKYFKVLLDYTYRLEQTKTINIRSRDTQSFIIDTSGVDMTPPSVDEDITIANVEGGIKISWKTNEESNDMLTLWETTKPQILLTTENEAGFSKGHSRGIAGLSTGKAYGYKITSTDEKGNSATITRTFNLN